MKVSNVARTVPVGTTVCTSQARSYRATWPVRAPPGHVVHLPAWVARQPPPPAPTVQPSYRSFLALRFLAPLPPLESRPAWRPAWLPRFRRAHRPLPSAALASAAPATMASCIMRSRGWEGVTVEEEVEVGGHLQHEVTWVGGGHVTVEAACSARVVSRVGAAVAGSSGHGCFGYLPRISARTCSVRSRGRRVSRGACHA